MPKIEYYTEDEILSLIANKYVVAICKEGYIVYDGDFKILDKISKKYKLESRDYPYNLFKSFLKNNSLILTYH